jgi:hypothetical protein
MVLIMQAKAAKEQIRFQHQQLLSFLFQYISVQILHKEKIGY